MPKSKKAAGNAQNQKEDQSMYWPLGLVLGISMGCAYGLLFEHLLIGVSLGAVFGCCFALILSSYHPRKQ